MIRKLYKSISDALLRRRYRKLYHRLFWHYAAKSEIASFAIQQADEAFFKLTGAEWEEWL